MIKKLIAFSVVLLLPVSFISSASAASKSVTCYKGTASKVVKNSSGKCPTGWSSKKPVTPKTPANTSNASYKVQDISSSEVAEMGLAIIDIKTPSKEYTNAVNARDELIKQQCGDINTIVVGNRIVGGLGKFNEYQICRKNFAPSLPALPIEKDKKIKYLPLTQKLLDNFCGLNGSLLADNLSLIRNADQAAGYARFSEKTMKPIYANLDLIEKNRSQSINTTVTDNFLEMFLFRKDSNSEWAQVSYSLKDVISQANSNILLKEVWEKNLNATAEYGFKTTRDNFDNLVLKLEATVYFCKNR